MDLNFWKSILRHVIEKKNTNLKNIIKWLNDIEYFDTSCPLIMFLDLWLIKFLSFQTLTNK